MLKVIDVHKSFGGFQALAGCSLEIAARSITGVMGPNGAGKSTLFNVIGGALFPTVGSILLKGESIGRLPAHRRAKAGLVRTFQISRELGQLTVLENMLLAHPRMLGDAIWRNFVDIRRVRRQERDAITKARELLEKVDLWDFANEPAEWLSGGQKKLLEIGRALMLDPQLILLDEPSAGVSPAMQRIVISTIRGLCAQGITFAIIEHDMEMIAELCNPIYVLAEGKTLTSGSFTEVTANRDVLRAYLGRTA